MGPTPPCYDAYIHQFILLPITHCQTFTYSKEDPLQRFAEVVRVSNSVESESILLVIMLLQVQQDSGSLEDDEVVTIVVYDHGDTTIRVVLGVLRSLLLVLAEVEVDRLVRQSKLFENVDDLPVSAA